MARKTPSRSTVRALAPVVIPLVTRVALPIAMQSLRRGGFRADGFSDGAKDAFEKSLKRTRSELDEVKEEAVARGWKLYEEARKHGTELLDILANKGLGLAQDWAESLGRPRRRRRFGLAKALGLVAFLGVGLILVSRK